MTRHESQWEALELLHAAILHASVQDYSLRKARPHLISRTSDATLHRHPGRLTSWHCANLMKMNE